MSRIKLMKNPGYIEDLFFIFFLNFNKEYCKKNFTCNTLSSEDKSEEEKASYFDEILKQFEPISDELYIFFHALSNGRCFFTSRYFDRYAERFVTDYDIHLIHEAILDQESLLKNIIEYYFYYLTEDEVSRCMESKRNVYEVIKNSDYSDTEKLRLYELFINPSFYIQKLQYELTVKDMILSEYYEKNYSRILDAYNSLNVEDVMKQLSPYSAINFEENEDKNLYVTFCLLNTEHINIINLEKSFVFILGDGYVGGIQAVKKTKKIIKLHEFGSAVSELNRVNILDFILEKGEVSCKDLEQRFNFTGSTAYHHLMMLMRFGVIKSRSEGKTVFYSIDNKYFDTVIKLLYKYSRNIKCR